MAEGVPMEIVEMRQLSRDGHLPMKNAPESMGYKIWPSCDVVLKSQTVTSVRTSVHVDLPLGYASVIHNKLGLAQEGIVVVPYVLDANFQGPLHLVVHNMGERDYKVLKENPLAQLIIHRVAVLPCAPCCAPSHLTHRLFKGSQSHWVHLENFLILFLQCLGR